MKCPECGFVSFPQPAECKKCGYRFETEPPSRAGSFTSQVSFRSQTSTPSRPIRPASDSSPHFPAAQESHTSDNSARPHAQPDRALFEPRAGPEPDPTDAGVVAARAQAWENEIAERVALYRRRRGGAHTEDDSEANLEFDFAVSASDAPDERESGQDGEDLDLILENQHGAEGETPLLDSIPIQRGSAAGLRPEDAAEWALEPSDFRVAAPEPVEILLNSSAEGEEEPEIIAAGRMRLAAPIGLRFTAGVVDAFILLVSAVVFALIFWKSGGRLTIGRHGEGVTNLLILGVLAAFFMVFYFGMFTALAFATPGQAAMGLEVRTLDGDRPDSRAARRRAFGYLVSAVALMLGFLWAIFDVDGLAWHDRVSGTCLARSRS